MQGSVATRRSGSSLANGGCITFSYVNGSSNSDHWSTPTKFEDPTAGMTADEKRAYRRLQDRLAFEGFVCERWAEHREGTEKFRTPDTSRSNSYGTSNGLRPTPMLC